MVLILRLIYILKETPTLAYHRLKPHKRYLATGISDEMESLVEYQIPGKPHWLDYLEVTKVCKKNILNQVVRPVLL